MMVAKKLLVTTRTVPIFCRGSTSLFKLQIIQYVYGCQINEYEDSTKHKIESKVSCPIGEPSATHYIQSIFKAVLSFHRQKTRGRRTKH